MGPLRKDGVQGVQIRTDDGVWTDRGGTEHPKWRNLAACIEKDLYAVCFKNEGYGDWAAIFTADIGDFQWGGADLHNKAHDDLIPIGCLHAWFEGGSVTTAQYKKVKTKFARMISGES